MPTTFKPNKKATKREYIVKDFLPMGVMATLLAQSGAGKTYVALGWGVAIATGNKVMGMETKQTKVLYIDQDEAEDDTRDRLSQFCNYYGLAETPLLETACMEGYQLKDRSLLDVIGNSDAGLVIVDTLTSVCNGLNMNDGTDMQRIKELYQHCVNPQRTILFLHHISEHKKFSLADMFTCDPSDLAMYSSKINQTIDGYYIIANPYKGEHARELYLRPVIKRYKIACGNVKFGLEQTDTTLHLSDLVDSELVDDSLLSTEEYMLLASFIEDKTQQTIAELVPALKKWIDESKIRKVVATLDKKGCLCMQRSGHNKYNYELVDKGKELFEYNRKLQESEGEAK